MPLDSTSTLTQIKAAYADNAAYEETGSVPMAKAFVTACRLLLLNLPAAVGQGGENLTLNVAAISQEMAAAKAWLSRNDASQTQTSPGYVTRADLRNR